MSDETSVYKCFGPKRKVRRVFAKNRDDEFMTFVEKFKPGKMKHRPVYIFRDIWDYAFELGWRLSREELKYEYEDNE